MKPRPKRWFPRIGAASFARVGSQGRPAHRTRTRFCTQSVGFAGHHRCPRAVSDDFSARVARFVRQNALMGNYGAGRGRRIGRAGQRGPFACLNSRFRTRPASPTRGRFAFPPRHSRKADADAEAAFCAGLSARFGLPCIIGLGVVPQKNGGYSNNDARRARYAFLEDVGPRIGGRYPRHGPHQKRPSRNRVVARFSRHGTLDGLSGIPARRDLSPGLVVVRPLLGESREAVEAFCQSEAVTPRRDPTNQNAQFTRVRVRRVLPDLARDFNPRLMDTLCRALPPTPPATPTCSTRLPTRLWEDAAENEEPAGFPVSIVRLRADPLRAAHSALRFRIMLRALRRATQNLREADEAATDAFVHVLDNLIARPNGGAADLPGKIRAHCDGETLDACARRRANCRAFNRFRNYEVPLSVPGSVNLLGLRISARMVLGPKKSPPILRAAPVLVHIACPLISGANGTMGNENTVAAIASLIVRSARPGDKFAPLGMNGQTRLVRDVLADAKIPGAERGTFPLVVRGDTGAILWVVGIAQAEETRITPETRGIVRLQSETLRSRTHVNIHIIDHPLARHLMTHLRDENTPPALFRTLTNHLTTLLALEATRDLPTVAKPTNTPLEAISSDVLAHGLIVVPILRAGLGMLPSILEIFPDVAVGYIGLARDHTTADCLVLLLQTAAP